MLERLIHQMFDFKCLFTKEDTKGKRKDSRRWGMEGTEFARPFEIAKLETKGI
jgi:hypothetical protein